MKNPLYGQQCNPERMEWLRADNPYHRPYDDKKFPYVVTTYRLTEHHTAGGMSRWVAWLSELQPELFCEVSPSWPRCTSWRMPAGPRFEPRGARSRRGC